MIAPLTSVPRSVTDDGTTVNKVASDDRTVIFKRPFVKDCPPTLVVPAGWATPPTAMIDVAPFFTVYALSAPGAGTNLVTFPPDVGEAQAVGPTTPIVFGGVFTVVTKYLPVHPAIET